MRVLVIGNCQAPGIARCLMVMAPQLETRPASPADADRLRAQGERFDLVVAQRGAEIDPRSFGAERVVVVPRIVFRGFHPDMGFLLINGRAQPSPTGAFHSRLALWGHSRGLGPETLRRCFDEAVFERLGYFAAWQSAEAQLLEEGRQTAIPLDSLLPRWRSQGCFMHGVVAPKLFVLADLAGQVLRFLGHRPVVDDPSLFLHDELKDEAVWAVYPPIAARLGLEGHYAFKAEGRGRPVLFDLDAFLAASFERYRQLLPEQMHCPDLDHAHYDAAFEASPQTAKPRLDLAGRHPFVGRASRHFWSRAVAGLPADEIDPVTPPPFRLGRETRIATAGSCFAQHLGRGLAGSGLRHHVVEDTADGVYPPYSARYGNIYTARQLVQLFDRAHGRFTPQDAAWRRDDGRLVDPYRQAEADPGFADEAALEADRAAHLAAVRRLFAELDVFVFTLGLTEAWASADDGAVFPLAPGVLAEAYDPARHRFVNFGVAEVIADLEGFTDRLATVNPNARVILTVSPVPLAATAEMRHVLEATTYSKAVLRTAADELARRRPAVTYFPAYEVVTGAHNRGHAFAGDLRNVTPDTVARVVRFFLRHYAADDRQGTVAPDAYFDVICEEQLVDATSAGDAS